MGPRFQAGPTLQSEQSKKGGGGADFGAEKRPATVPVLGPLRAPESGGRERPASAKPFATRAFTRLCRAEKQTARRGSSRRAFWGQSVSALGLLGTPEGNRTPIYSSGGCRLIHWATGACPKLRILTKLSSLSTILPASGPL